jgi:murein DD-endopeptidase MepM/ murein hydrolase activator NlpD
VKKLAKLGAKPVDLVILLDAKDGREVRLSLTPRFVTFACTLVLAVAVAGGWGLRAAASTDLDVELAQSWSATLDAQQQELERVRHSAETTLGALTRRFSELQARLVRMEALGERVANIADFDTDEFDFSQLPGLGGPDDPDAEPVMPFDPPPFLGMVDDLSDQILARHQQLAVLETMLDERRFVEEVSIAGRPIAKGWMSSPFGRRIDPIRGGMAWHGGVDFAGPEGSDVLAVAGGVVTWADERHGYGRLIEITHGGGYVTRYGHNKTLKVSVGQTVRKGEVIAAMGSTGRSTGPHVHFEVLKNGKPVNPARYVARARG